MPFWLHHLRPVAYTDAAFDFPAHRVGCAPRENCGIARLRNYELVSSFLPRELVRVIVCYLQLTGWGTPDTLLVPFVFSQIRFIFEHFVLPIVLITCNSGL